MYVNFLKRQQERMNESRMTNASTEQQGADIKAKIKLCGSLVESWWFDIDRECHNPFTDKSCGFVRLYDSYRSGFNQISY